MCELVLACMLGVCKKGKQVSPWCEENEIYNYRKRYETQKKGSDLKHRKRLIS